MDGKIYQNALYGRMVSCLDDKGQLDSFMVSLHNCVDIVWELAKIAKEEEYPEYFQDRVLDLLEAYNIDYKHLGEDKDNDQSNK